MIINDIIKESVYLRFRRKRKDIGPFEYLRYRQMRTLMSYKGVLLGIFAFVVMYLHYRDKKYESRKVFEKRMTQKFKLIVMSDYL